MTDLEEALKDGLVSGARDRIGENVEKVARSLERMAEEVRRGATVENITIDPEIVAANVIHTMTWGFANAGLDSLVRAVADYNTLLTAVHEREAHSA